MHRMFRLAPVAMALLLGTPVLAQAPAGGQATEGRQAAQRPVPPRSFRSPEEGFSALIAALRAHDERALLGILGSAAQRLIRSGDRVADRVARDAVVEAYAARNEIVRDMPHRAVLQIGEDGWPLPIPLMQHGNAWRFDAAAATQEIVDRRIGRNELDTIETLGAVADAQDEFARTAGRRGALRTYARRFFSTPGQRDGLYWPAAEGEPESPLGPLMAAASAGGYSQRREGERPQPYHGYIYRILERQGPGAPGGAMDYVVDGKMIGGFAVIAYPAGYGSTGIKTFMINHDGRVWEKDLGPDTAREAQAIRAFDPSDGWEDIP